MENLVRHIVRWYLPFIIIIRQTSLHRNYYKCRKSHKRELTSDRNELLYNFLLVIRAFNANRFCYIGNWEGRELARVRGGGDSGQ